MLELISSISLQGIMVSKRWNYVSAILLSLHIRPVHVISVSCRGANSIILSFTGFSHQQFACFSRQTKEGTEMRAMTENSAENKQIMAEAHYPFFVR